MKSKKYQHLILCAIFLLLCLIGVTAAFADELGLSAASYKVEFLWTDGVTVMGTLDVKDGDCLDEADIPAIDASGTKIVTSWLLADSGEPFDLQTPIQQDYSLKPGEVEDYVPETPLGLMLDEQSGDAGVVSDVYGEVEDYVPEAPPGLMLEEQSGDVSVVSYVYLITDREIEIGFDTPILDSAAAAATFKVTVDGEEVDYDYLSYFDFGSYETAPAVNIRLKDPLNVGTLSGRTGTAVTPNSGTYTTLGPAAAERVKVVLIATSAETQAVWKPFYTYRQIGQKSKIHATGNAANGTLAANDSIKGVAYNGEYVINFCGEGINKMTGRAELLTQNAVEAGLCVKIVGTDQSVYQAPEYRELYVSGETTDAFTRTHIAGTLDKPIIVTTADDVMRQASTGEMDRPKSDLFYMGEAFARLFWTLGVVEGCPRTPRSFMNDYDDYNYAKHIEDAYNHAKANNMWGNGTTKMMESAEDYFTYAAMVWYEFIPESADGAWHSEAFPVNTREELKRYDPDLFRPMCGIFGEWEYFSGLSNQTAGFDTGRDGVRSGMPWFWHTQADNYNIDGEEYEELEIEHVWVISSSEVEVKFNREIKDMTAACTSSNWQIERSLDGGATWTPLSTNIRGSYLWKAITLSASNLTTGTFGEGFSGFTQEDLDERSVANGGWIPNSQQPSATALKKGEFVGVDDAVARGAGINGMIRVRFLDNTPIRDWDGNALASDNYGAEFHPWVGNVYRSPLTGVYIYADTGVSKKTIELAGYYYDSQCANNQTITYPNASGGALTPVTFDRVGQRIADYATRQNGGMKIIAEGQHAMQQSRNQENSSYHNALYVEGWGGTKFQDEAVNIERDYSLTRYKNEFLLYHEGGHGVDSYTGGSSYAPFVYTDITSAHNAATSYENGRRWYDVNNVGAYLSSRGEYVSTGSTYWHGTMRQSKDGTNDGTWTPICNRWTFWRYDPFGFEAFKRLYFDGDLGLWYCDENGVPQFGNPEYRVLPGDWKYLQYDEELNERLTLQYGLHGNGETLKIDSEDALIAWGCTNPITLNYDPYTGYSNPDFKWVSWATANIYDITLKDELNPDFPNNRYDFKGGVHYFPEEPTKSFNNPFLEYPYVKKPVRSAEDEALIAPVTGVASNLGFYSTAVLKFDFNQELTVDNVQSSFIVEVDGERMPFRFYSYKDGEVMLRLHSAVEEEQKVELTVVTTGQKIPLGSAGGLTPSAAINAQEKVYVLNNKQVDYVISMDDVERANMFVIEADFDTDYLDFEDYEIVLQVPTESVEQSYDAISGKFKLTFFIAKRDMTYTTIAPQDVAVISLRVKDNVAYGTELKGLLNDFSFTAISVDGNTTSSPDVTITNREATVIVSGHNLDLNGDYELTLEDIALVVYHYFLIGEGHSMWEEASRFDLVGNGLIDTMDIIALYRLL
ncbi:hypothetical protein [Candidatus Formimonas warabiya]|uniref:Dockerin domain-containing protein n=1 Tax=Formimonas warabiya TaxID=1761012 RepID=A0A3G1KWA8_FORW1|nr:hypothetical protein [Candidatus Formimonas warabiya]ATW26754.1 hypothetical protein DCMF_20075 [Candidatus Formimonas warabiya]